MKKKELKLGPQGAFEFMASIFPRDLARWLLSKTIDPKLPKKVQLARFVEDSSIRFVYPVPAVQGDLVYQNESKRESLEIRNLFAKDLGKDNFTSIRKDGPVKSHPFTIDDPELRRQILLQGGCPIQLAALVEENGESSPATIGVVLPGPCEDGQKIPFYLLDKLNWQYESCQYLFFEKERMKRPQNPSNYYPFFFSLYLWPGTGLFDPEEFFFLEPTSLVKKNDLRPPKPFSGRRDQLPDHDFQLLQKGKHTRRREAFFTRKDVLGDPMMGLEELEEICSIYNPEDEGILFSFSYDAIRLWEIPLQELLEELPTGCLGLSLFGYRPKGFTIKDAVQQSFFTLRYRIQKERLMGQESRKALLSLSSLAANWTDIETIAYYTHRFGF